MVILFPASPAHIQLNAQRLQGTPCGFPGCSLSNTLPTNSSYLSICELWPLSPQLNKTTCSVGLLSLHQGAGTAFGGTESPFPLTTLRVTVLHFLMLYDSSSFIDFVQVSPCLCGTGCSVLVGVEILCLFLYSSDLLLNNILTFFFEDQVNTHPSDHWLLTHLPVVLILLTATGLVLWWRGGMGWTRWTVAYGPFFLPGVGLHFLKMVFTLICK